MKHQLKHNTPRMNEKSNPLYELVLLVLPVHGADDKSGADESNDRIDEHFAVPDSPWFQFTGHQDEKHKG